MYYTALHCKLLFDTTLYCTTCSFTIIYCIALLYCTLLYCIFMYSVEAGLHYSGIASSCCWTKILPQRYTTLYYTVFHHVALQHTILHCTALHCTTLHCTALHCTVLQRRFSPDGLIQTLWREGREAGASTSTRTILIQGNNRTNLKLMKLK